MSNSDSLEQGETLQESADGEHPLAEGCRMSAASPLLVVKSSKKLALICGVNDSHLTQLGRLAGTHLWARGDTIFSRSEDAKTLEHLRTALENLDSCVECGIIPEKNLLTSLIKECYTPKIEALVVGSSKVFARNQSQQEYLRAIQSHQLTFALGPAGTGKTFLAIAVALDQVLTHRKRVLVLSRPVLEAGENLGFLPGSYVDKLDPYLKPLYDAVVKLIGVTQFERLRQAQKIEIAPLAYMRGRTLDHAFVILDEAQNSTKKQMKLFLTRLGEESTAVVTGDPSQIDLRRFEDSGLKHAVKLLKDLPAVASFEFLPQHVVRSELVQQIVDAYLREGKQ